MVLWIKSSHVCHPWTHVIHWKQAAQTNALCFIWLQRCEITRNCHDSVQSVSALACLAKMFLISMEAWATDCFCTHEGLTGEKRWAAIYCNVLKVNSHQSNPGTTCGHGYCRLLVIAARIVYSSHDLLNVYHLLCFIRLAFTVYFAHMFLQSHTLLVEIQIRSRATSKCIQENDAWEWLSLHCTVLVGGYFFKAQECVPISQIQFCISPTGSGLFCNTL